MEEQINHEAAKSYHESYEGYAKTLRTWFAAYAIGAPVLVVSNDKMGDKLLKSGSAGMVLTLFLVAVSLQVLIAALNKVVMWAVYYQEIKPQHKTRRRFRFADWLSEQFWIDFLVDAGTIVLLVWGTVRLAHVLIG